LLENAETPCSLVPQAYGRFPSRARCGAKELSAGSSLFRRNLLDHGYIKLPISSEHAGAVFGLPPIHTEPFDRLLIVQAIVEGLMHITHDARMAQYPGAIRKV
jgi:PIN domain nuclease of toxin-antitoxin system